MSQANPKQINTETVGFFRYKKIGRQYLLTNDFGQYAWLNQSQFKSFIQGKLNPSDSVYQELQVKNFLKNKVNLDKAIEVFQQRHSFLFQGPSLHIIVVTLRCNYN